MTYCVTVVSFMFTLLSILHYLYFTFYITCTDRIWCEKKYSSTFITLHPKVSGSQWIRPSQTQTQAERSRLHAVNCFGCFTKTLLLGEPT